MSLNPLFRKVSIERLSSPEQLDKLLVIVKIKGWLALAALISITVALLVWSFLGKIPIEVQGRGLLLDPSAVEEIISKGEGHVTRILTKTGAEVKEGETLIILENPSLESNLLHMKKQFNILIETLVKERASLAQIQEGSPERIELEKFLLSLEIKKEQLQDELSTLETQKENLTVKAPKNGQVIEIDVTLGKEVLTNSLLLWLQAPTPKGETMPFYTFVSLSLGQKIHEGMRAQITLVAIDTQQYGQIEGRVDHVLPYAASEGEQYIAGIPSRLIQGYLGEEPFTTLVVITPLTDPSSPTGYKWTIPGGPPVHALQPGSLGSVRITLESKRPISYVLPIFKE